MTEKELKKLSRAELLELLRNQMEENSRLKKEHTENPGDGEVAVEPLQINKEREKESSRSRYAKAVRSTIYILVTIAAVAVLISTLFLPIFRIYGSSMTPTLREGNLAVGVKSGAFKQGDVIAFYYNNKILVKRVVACAGDWVDIDAAGNVYVNDQLLDEPYVKEKALGECDIELPYQVPDGRLFVCGDHRSTSVDSRSSSVGCVAEEQIAGKIIFRVWPLSDFGIVD